MSHSYKKTPYCGDNKGKIKKRIANHKVRNWLKNHPEHLLNRSQYKNVFERYDVCDYYDLSSWDSYWNSVLFSYTRFKRYFDYPYPNKKKEYQKYNKEYLRK